MKKSSLLLLISLFILFSCQNKKKANEYLNAASNRLKDQNGQLDSAGTYQSIDDYTHAIKYDKTSVTAYRGRADLYGDIGEYEKAIADIETAMKYADKDEKERLKKSAEYFKVQMEVIPLTKKNLQGTWYLNKWEMYHTLIFDTGGVTMDNHVDTVFRLGYELIGKDIILFKGDMDYRNQVIRLTKDELVFKNIMTLDEQRKYTRTKKPIY